MAEADLTPDLLPLVTFLIARPDARRRLIAEHVDDGRGQCKVCALGGQRGHRA